MNIKIAKVKAGVSGEPVMKVVAKGKTACTAIKSNPNFKLTVDSATVEAEIAELEVLEQKVMSGDHSSTVMRDEVFRSVKSNLVGWVGEINAQAAGDVQKLETSGFELVKQRTPRPTPKQIKKLSLRNGSRSGMVHANWSGDKGKSFYIFQRTLTPEMETSWQTIYQDTTNRLTMDGLEQGSNIYCRVCATNTAGVGQWSEPSTLFVS